jgi:hypothetical protein
MSSSQASQSAPAKQPAVARACRKAPQQQLQAAAIARGLNLSHSSHTDSSNVQLQVLQMTPRCHCSTDLLLLFLQRALLLQPHQRLPVLQQQTARLTQAAFQQLQEQIVPRQQLLVWITCRA